jgi:hypothetical protein
VTAIDEAFPSDAWFSELVARALADRSALERLGIAELRLGIEITEDGNGPRLFGIVLDGYDIESLGELADSELGAAATVSGPLEAWREMVASIEEHGQADTAHTLNTLSIAGVPFTLRSADSMGYDKFFRYMGTLQALFDGAGSPASPAVVD